MCFEHGSIRVRPCIELGKAVVEEYVEEREERVLFRGKHSVDLEEWVEVEEGGQAEGLRNCGDCGGLGGWRGRR